MSSSESEILRRATDFSSRSGLLLEDRLGFGKDGIVWSTNVATVVKVFERPERWSQELAVYERLRSRGVSHVRGHQVPRLLSDDPELLAIEMTLVRRPFVLDFASARLDFPPDFPPEVVADWETEKSEEFGPNWPAAKSILASLEGRYGIYLLDVHPGNIGFREP